MEKNGLFHARNAKFRTTSANQYATKISVFQLFIESNIMWTNTKSWNNNERYCADNIFTAERAKMPEAKTPFLIGQYNIHESSKPSYGDGSTGFGMVTHLFLLHTWLLFHHFILPAQTCFVPHRPLCMPTDMRTMQTMEFLACDPLPCILIQWTLLLHS